MDEKTKYGIIELRDGLTIGIIEAKYPWLLKAQIESAIVGEHNNYLVWYNGVWKKGAWLGGYWRKGIWHSGDWICGIWASGYWMGGYWHGGYWFSGDDKNDDHHIKPPNKWFERYGE